MAEDLHNPLKVHFMPLTGNTARCEKSSDHSPILEFDRPGFLSCSTADSLPEPGHSRKLQIHKGT